MTSTIHKKWNITHSLVVCLIALNCFISDTAKGEENDKGEENELKLPKSFTLDKSGIWRFSNSLHSSFTKLGSSDAQEGHHLLEINGSDFSFPFENEAEHEYYGFIKGRDPQGFLFHSISADKFIGKHIHVSAFAKSIKPKFGEIEKRFEQWLLEERETNFTEPIESINNGSESNRSSLAKGTVEKILDSQRDRKLNEFAEYLRVSNASARFGISVLLHFKEDENGESRIALHEPTSVGAPSENDFWNRFNVEFAVPRNCKAISIVLWSKGVNIVHYDHVAAVTHGQAIDFRLGKYRNGWSDDIYKAVVPLATPLSTSFNNMSFED